MRHPYCSKESFKRPFNVLNTYHNHYLKNKERFDFVIQRFCSCDLSIVQIHLEIIILCVEKVRKRKVKIKQQIDEVILSVFESVYWVVTYIGRLLDIHNVLKTFLRYYVLRECLWDIYSVAIFATRHGKINSWKTASIYLNSKTWFMNYFCDVIDQTCVTS